MILLSAFQNVKKVRKIKNFKTHIMKKPEREICKKKFDIDQISQRNRGNWRQCFDFLTQIQCCHKAWNKIRQIK